MAGLGPQGHRILATPAPLGTAAHVAGSGSPSPGPATLPQLGRAEVLDRLITVGDLVDVAYRLAGGDALAVEVIVTAAVPNGSREFAGTAAHPLAVAVDPETRQLVLSLSPAAAARLACDAERPRS